MRWLFPDVYDCVKRLRQSWVKEHRWTGRISIPDSSAERTFFAFLPTPLLQRFLEICLDNLPTSAFLDVKSQTASRVSIGISRDDSHLEIAITDNGHPFAPRRSITDTTLGKLSADVQRFGAAVILPQEGTSPKAFTLRVPRIELGLSQTTGR